MYAFIFISNFSVSSKYTKMNTNRKNAIIKRRKMATFSLITEYSKDDRKLWQSLEVANSSWGQLHPGVFPTPSSSPSDSPSCVTWSLQKSVARRGPCCTSSGPQIRPCEPHCRADFWASLQRVGSTRISVQQITFEESQK